MMVIEQNSSARRTVIEALIQFGEIPRTDLAAHAGLSRSTVTQVTQELLDCGMVVELPVVYDGQRRGRPSVRLSLRAEYGCFAGAAISEVLSSMALTDLRGRVLAECELPSASEPTELAGNIRKGMEQLIRAAAVEPASVLGLGLAVPGIVDQPSGVCSFSAVLGWRDVPIVDLVAAATHTSTCAGNDADAIAIAQKLFGAAREMENFASIILGRTVGCAQYMDRRLCRGHSGSVGEIGHMTIDPAGEQCRCGKRGCLDTIAGGHAIRDKAKAAGLVIESMRDLELLAAEGNLAAVELLRRAGEGLGLAVANLVQINNPQTVLFADLEGFGNGLFYTVVRQTIENNILPRLLPSTQIIFQPVEYSFLARGAASVAAQAYLLDNAGGNGR
jgi:predicted NBD/HSP70 family sugar kinase